MPKAKRVHRERTDDYAQIQQRCRTPEQRLYEGIRSVVLYGVTSQEQAAAGKPHAQDYLPHPP